MDGRDVAPHAGARWFWRYVTVVVSAGLTGLILAVWHLSPTDIIGTGAPLLVVILLLLAAEIRPLVVSGSTEANGITTSTAFVFALLLAFGAAPAILAQATATLISDRLKHRAWWRTAFNISQYTLSWAAAAGVLQLLGTHSGPLQPLRLQARDLPAILAAAITYFVVNDLLVSAALALRGRSPLRTELFADFRYQAAATGSLLALSPLVVVVMQRSALLVPLFLLPLFAIYATAAISLQQEHQAHHDALTGLANRKLLTSTAIQLLADAGRHHTSVALCILDLDEFKAINDANGHHVGDQVLQAVAQHISDVIRPGDFLARLGGDEFAVLIPFAGDPGTASRAAHRISDAIRRPIGHDGTLLNLRGSVGVALYPAHATDLTTLMRFADAAMYIAKRNGTALEIHHPTVPAAVKLPEPREGRQYRSSVVEDN